MPLYTYKCTNCGYVFEARQRMSDNPLEECPVCQGGVRRVINSVGVVFKGQGFYVTDNRRSTTIPPGSASTTSSEPDAAEKTTPAPKTEPTTPAAESSSA